MEDEGEDRLAEIIDRMHDPILNADERRFIQEVIGRSFWSLTKHQKAVVNRIYGWLQAQKDDDD